MLVFVKGGSEVSSLNSVISFIYCYNISLFLSLQTARVHALVSVRRDHSTGSPSSAPLRPWNHTASFHSTFLVPLLAVRVLVPLGNLVLSIVIRYLSRWVRGIRLTSNWQSLLVPALRPTPTFVLSLRYIL